METMNYEEWKTDLRQGRALHSSGLCLRIDGDPKDPSGVTPVNYSSLTIADQARLLREGLAAMAAAARSGKGSSPTVTSAHPGRANARARLFAGRFGRHSRPRLSLKKT